MARADVHVYSFKNVICAIGSHMPSGFAGDNCITITPQGDGITDEAGADGEVVVSNSDDPRYEVKMIFVYGSKSNAVLRKLYNLQKQSSGGYFFPLMMPNSQRNFSLNRMRKAVWATMCAIHRKI